MKKEAQALHLMAQIRSLVREAEKIALRSEIPPYPMGCGAVVCDEQLDIIDRCMKYLSSALLLDELTGATYRVYVGAWPEIRAELRNDWLSA